MSSCDKKINLEAVISSHNLLCKFMHIINCVMNTNTGAAEVFVVHGMFCTGMVCTGMFCTGMLLKHLFLLAMAVNLIKYYM